MTHPLTDLAAAFRSGTPRGIPSVCSAHPVVIEAALRLGLETGRPVLVEATCNQVNQDGGYTGMTPAAFRAFVEGIASRCGLDPARVILGGDHLGPNPWKHLPPAEAMAKAEAMIAAYAEAGFTKLHLDTSMGCAGEPAALDDATTASRAARLAAVAERQRSGAPPVYVVGTEVPVPGGAVEEIDELSVTEPGAVRATFDAHRSAFDALGQGEAFSRVIALVVQPGVEFGHAEVAHFDQGKAAALSACLDGLPGIVFEAHSTDYQSEAALAGLVAGGFAILKVGPWLTFALREALYGLDSVADVLEGHPPRGKLMAVMDDLMRADPTHWARYYQGDASGMWLQRHFSYSDRIRYYWPRPEAEAAVAALRARLADRRIPAPVMAQYLPGLPAGPADAVLLAAVQRVLRMYDSACYPASAPGGPAGGA